MSETNTGTHRFVGSSLQPIIVRVDGSDRSALEDLFELRGNCSISRCSTRTSQRASAAIPA
jgi:hypothetical protein